ncbi:hypothetical protein K431DRAFT_160481 [Polychaeton citri CBS 116435]|uniref:Uncharacterized protein n=1 Tax=Polychaeton citri CBS 116435 TaxID=1314669 RepID=A0A9P4Q024_9PEZI|nr:hypothetical protein K431DRAFT_160481 [Polychaeton citri CBS 116435]
MEREATARAWPACESQCRQRPSDRMSDRVARAGFKLCDHHLEGGHHGVSSYQFGFNDVRFDGNPCRWVGNNRIDFRAAIIRGHVLSATMTHSSTVSSAACSSQTDLTTSMEVKVSIQCVSVSIPFPVRVLDLALPISLSILHAWKAPMSRYPWPNSPLVPPPWHRAVRGRIDLSTVFLVSSRTHIRVYGAQVHAVPTW